MTLFTTTFVTVIVNMLWLQPKLNWLHLRLTLYTTICLTVCITTYITVQPRLAVCNVYGPVYNRTCVYVQPHVWLCKHMHCSCYRLTYHSLCSHKQVWHQQAVMYWMKERTHHHVGVPNCLHFVHVIILNGGIETSVEIVQKIHNLQHGMHIWRPVETIELFYLSHFITRGASALFKWRDCPGQTNKRAVNLAGK